MNKLFLLSGTSGVGKTTIAYKLLEQMPDLKRLVTYVTREPRPGEVDGIDYHFVTREEFEKRLAAGEFFEHDEHYGNWYGNSRKDLDAIWAGGKIAITLLDVNGVRTIKKIFPEAKTIFVEPDNLENLKGRIRQRPMTDEAFEKRWAKVQEEMKEAADYDFRVVNAEGKLDKAVERVRNIIGTPQELQLKVK
ncbi:guanylate kinase [Candidatus Falkowbacteria bacterium RIFOXYC2_FULL_48_21]|uniref:Guanylate kinase n=1 Tax=Candidatus Falkowbacteria bacterium RIFOXYC2_FULL_48_21 TaxID=1798005 RepID=A0A1F5TGT6_9BACT|nr:MAG: guanylate kinase [Candidatus Falkowbacteria bacterium RIFOXYC2_FULL_48_21]